MKRAWVWVGLMIAALAGISPDGGANALDSPTPPVAWRDALGQKADWYGGPEAIRIAENVVLHQRDSGGWPKNQELAASLTESERTEVLRQKGRADSTIDNGATVEEMTFLAKVYNATKREPYRRAFLKGLDFLFAAQYPNGGWPQFYPNPTGYHRHITFNDGAMIGVMTLLRDIARNEPDYRFVEKSRRQRAGEAVRKGIDCTLKTQVRANGKRTVWCAQHDSVTLEPAPARTYEKASLSGSESVGIVRFLMGIEKPGPEVIEAIEAAIRWFEAAKLTGIRVAQKPDSTLPRGYDRVVVEDPAAPPLWARFYEIGTNRPIFSGRDGIIKRRFSEIEHERRIGYAWYVNSPAQLLERDYPAWKKQHGR